MKNLLLIFAVLIAISSISNAEKAFKSYVPNGAKFDCLTCHNTTDGGKNWNKFGTAIKNSYLVNAKPKWGPALAALDSDGDGVTNGQELGDPNGTWTFGSANPGVLANITNPGNASSVTGIEDVISALEFISINGVNPNPASINANLNFTVKEAGNIQLDIFDVNGNLLSNLANDYFTAGNHNLNLSTSNLNSGSYYLKMSYGYYPLYYKFIVNK